MIHPAVSIASSTAPAAVSLLQTTAIEHELHPEDEIVQVDFGDLPRPTTTTASLQVIRSWIRLAPAPKTRIPRSPYEAY
jgi:hypothetical protein